MGIARGRATVRFGGENGHEIEIVPGDVVILPAGTGHQCLKQTADAGRHRRLSAERQIQSLPRQQARPRQGARHHPESAAARDRSGVRAAAARCSRCGAHDVTADWLAFWDTSHPIYVNARHKDVHYRLIAQAIARAGAGACRARARLRLRRGAARRSGRGGGRRTPAVRRRAGRARRDRRALCRQSENPRARAGGGRSACRSIRSISSCCIRSRSTSRRRKPARCSQCSTGCCRADGVLVVSDVIPPNVPAVTDALALLRFGAANGFLFAALAGLVRTRLSDYWRLRTRFGLTRYSEAAMIEKLAAAGFTARRAADNIGHNQARMAFWHGRDSFLACRLVVFAAAALAWLGRQGPRAIAAIVFIAIALPALDALLKPFVSEAVFALLCLAFLRMDTVALLRHVRRPWLVLAATAWTSLAIARTVRHRQPAFSFRRTVACAVSGADAAGRHLTDDGLARLRRHHGLRCDARSLDAGRRAAALTPLSALHCARLTCSAGSAALETLASPRCALRAWNLLDHPQPVRMLRCSNASSAALNRP